VKPALEQGQALLLGIGLAFLAGGGFVFSRRVTSEQAVYIRRIAGTMLCGFGFALSVFGLGLMLAMRG
jgi:LPXTG-motif cell wall-anchored protein